MDNKRVKSLGEAIKEIVRLGCRGHIDYTCRETHSGEEYIDVYLRGAKVFHVDGDDPQPFIDALRAETDKVDGLTVRTRVAGLCFPRPEYSPAYRKEVPVEICYGEVEQPRENNVVERYADANALRVWEVIEAHPDYELFVTRGLAFNGAEEKPFYRSDSGYAERLEGLIANAERIMIRVDKDEIHLQFLSKEDLG